MTVPNPEASREEVVINGPSKGTFLPNPGKKAHKEDETEVVLVRFGAFNVLYDEDGNSYSVDDASSAVHSP